MEIFTRLGGAMLSRWGHFLFGITWIGLLYYFNFVQTPAFAQFEAGPRGEATRKLVPRALWWFRWAALFTVLTGLLILGFQDQYKGDYLKSPSGTSILTGALLGLIMATNVWMIIWPNQRIVIANAEGTAAGREADPKAAPAARRGALASRTNTLFSIPLLFFMGFTSHLATSANHYKWSPLPSGSDLLPYWIIMIVVIGLIEANALGVFGTDTGGTRWPLDDHRRTIWAGFILWAVMYIVFEIFLRR